MVNGVVALLATGGSTNHTMHLVAVAAAAGIQLTWDDFADLSAATPLLARVYPNGPADINQFHAAGGMPFVIGELLDAGLMHPDVDTVAGTASAATATSRTSTRPTSCAGGPRRASSRDLGVLRGVATRSRPTAASACSTAASAARS